MNRIAKKTIVIVLLLYNKPLYSQSEYYLKVISSILCNDTIKFNSNADVFINAINSPIKEHLPDSLQLNCKKICLLKSNKLMNKYFKNAKEKIYFISAIELNDSDSLINYSVTIGFIKKEDSRRRKKKHQVHIYSEFLVSIKSNEIERIKVLH